MACEGITTFCFVCAFAVLVPSAFGRNIVFIVADDLGWNDVGFHNDDMITPNIDKLAKLGVILNSSYVQPVCTPSRNAFMTGVYPFKVGLQRGVILPRVPECSPLNLTFLPQTLKELGYATHIVGKWHLGMCNWNCTPTYRGFDSFLGYYNGAEDYYTKIVNGYMDFRYNTETANETAYSSYIYAKRATQIIEQHDKEKPLFLYLPFQSVHSPVQVPDHFANLYPHIENQQRRQYCGMVSALDEAIGQVVSALETTGLLKDTLIIFTADNGGIPTASGNNYPLRGAKSTVFEGGTRAAAFVYGNGLEKSGYTYNGLLHAVDWNPTIIAAAGGNSGNGDVIDNVIDGVNQWDAIRTGGVSRRTELVYNLDDAFFAQQGHAAIRVGDYKLIQGYPGPFSDWYKPEQMYKTEITGENENDFYEKLMLEDFKHDRGLFEGDGLYNLKDDPTEHNDLSNELPHVVDQLKSRLDEYRKSLVPPKAKFPDPKSNPTLYGGYWTPGWC